MAQVAIITASDSGIGKECALLLAQQGFDIGITWHSDEEGAKDTAREVVSHGVRAEIVQLDLGNLPEGALALEKLIQRLGRIDVLVNNAGAMTKAPFLDMAFDEWRKIFTVDGGMSTGTGIGKAGKTFFTGIGVQRMAGK